VHATVAVTGTFTVVGDCITAAVAVVMKETYTPLLTATFRENHQKP
jgi:hypothetical protein